MIRTIKQLNLAINSGEIVNTSNSTKLSNLFNGRQQYDTLFRIVNTDKVETIDLWNDKTYYGRIDYDQQPVLPKQEYIKLLGNNQVSVLAPVADAFKELSDSINKDYNIRKINRKTNYYPLNPVDGYKDLLLDYTSKVRPLFEFQTNSYTRVLNKRKNIINFVDYVDNFIELSYYTNTLVTLSNFILSSTPLYSGLIIDLKFEDKTSDKVKQVNYIEDPNFKYFLTKAEEFGFKLDKNIPWRIVFDIESINSRKYLEPYNISNVNQFFEKFYTKAISKELELLQEELVKSYNNFVKINPKLVIKNNCTETTIFRKEITLEEINKQEYELRWIKFHFFIKLKEANLINKEEEFNFHINNLVSIYNTDSQRLMKYIESNTKIIKDGGSNQPLKPNEGLTSSKVSTKLYMKF